MLNFFTSLAICACLIISNSSAQVYPSQNITLLAKWDTSITTPEPVYGIKYQSVWGWVDPQDNREYAILGSTDGTYIIDVTVPTDPVIRDYVAGRRDSCIWREYKTYQNYLYAVSDDSSPNSFQIIDLSYLPDSVSVVYDSSDIFERSHTIFIDGSNLYCGSVTGPVTGGHANMAVFSLTNPAVPALLRTIEQDYPSSDNVHDMFVRNDTVYASSSYSGLFVYKFVSNQFSLIGSLTSYVDQGYNHSSALTADGRTLVMCDEVPASLAVKVLDVSNPGNIAVLDTFKSHPLATPHNPYVIGNRWAVIAYYQDGVYIYDISSPSSATKSGFFDTHPQNGDNNGYPSPPYQGCWGAYVDLPSGIILASDMQNGLFVLDASSILSVPSISNNLTAEVFPNPSGNDFTLNLSFSTSQSVNYEIRDIAGKLIIKRTIDVPAGKSSFPLQAKHFSAGAYILKIYSSATLTAKDKAIFLSKKLIKLR